MAAKKFYAVRKGKITGVFSNWADCKASVEGYPGAEYKGFATLEEAPADTEELFYADAEEEPLYEEITEESDAWPYEEEPVQDLTDELPAEEISEWQYDPETGEVFEYAEEQGEYAEDLYELPEEEILPDETEDPEVLAEEAALEKTEELEDEIYVEPDITGDEAPAPDSYYIESDKDDQ